jgi:hypothetical protein
LNKNIGCRDIAILNKGDPAAMAPRQDENVEVCHAHSGILAQVKIGGAIIGGLMLIFMALLGGMWSSLREQNAAIMTEVKCLATDSDVKFLRDRTDFIKEKQIELDNRIKTLERGR